MPATDPRPGLAADLADIVLPQAHGDDVRLGDLWASRPAILVHLRHFGWLFCREHVAQLRDAVDDVRSIDASLAAVGTGDLDYARNFAEEREIDFPLLVDETSASYRAVGTRKGSKAGLLNPKLAVSGAKAMASGHLQGKTGRAPLVLGAAHVIRPDGSVPFAWVNDDYDDNAPVDEMLAALR